MPELDAGDVVLHVEIDGDGEPVTLFCHGLTNNRSELAPFMPLLGGTKVRFDFRGHGESGSPLPGSYRFADFARDVRAVADAYGATRAVGTSLGAGALCHLLVDDPGRFERLVFLLPAGLDRPFQYKERYLRIAEVLETMPLAQAVETLLADPERRAAYGNARWLEDFDRENLGRMNPIGVPRAIRDVVEDFPVKDREQLAAVTAPTLVISRDGDPVHLLLVGQELARIMPGAELIAYGTGEEMFADLPTLARRVAAFLAG